VIKIILYSLCRYIESLHLLEAFILQIARMTYKAYFHDEMFITFSFLQMLSVYQPKGLKVMGAMSVVRNSIGSGLSSLFFLIVVKPCNAGCWINLPHSCMLKFNSCYFIFNWDK